MSLGAVFVIIFVAFNLPAFRGVRLAAAVVLLVLFGLSSLPLTYFMSSFFDVSLLTSRLPASPSVCVRDIDRKEGWLWVVLVK